MFFAHKWLGTGDAKKVYMLKVTQQAAARIPHRGVYSNWPTRGNTERGAESDI